MRDSHWEPDRMRGATSIKRGNEPEDGGGGPGTAVASTIVADVECVGHASERADTWTMSSARNLSVRVAIGSSSRRWQSAAMRRPKGISSVPGKSLREARGWRRSRFRAPIPARRSVQPASWILQRYMEVGKMVTFSGTAVVLFHSGLLDVKRETFLNNRTCKIITIE